MMRFRPILFALFIAVLTLPPTGRADQTNVALDDLFDRLKASTDASDATVIEGLIWRIWIHRGIDEIDQKMALGIVAMGNGNLQESLSYFDEVVRSDPDFAEGWNKRATVYYMLGNFEASVADIKRTLALEPRHFGALSGMGLIYDAIGNQAAAAKVWEKALEINPHMEGIRHRMDEIRVEEKPI